MSRLPTISVDERDLFSYLDIEQYIIERKYLLNMKEYLLLKEKSELLKVKQMEFFKDKYDMYPKEMVSGIAVFVFQSLFGGDFHCWANIAKESNELPRHRDLKINSEDVNSIEALKKFILERNFIINSKELPAFDGLAHKLNNANRIYYREGDYLYKFDGEHITRDWQGKTISSFKFFKNQTAGVRYSEIQNEKIYTGQMFYANGVLERRRNKDAN